MTEVSNAPIPCAGLRSLPEVLTRKSCTVGVLGLLISVRTKAADVNPALRAEKVRGFFIVKDQSGLLANGSYRVQTYTPLDIQLFESSEAGIYEHYLRAAGDGSLRIAGLRIDPKGSVRLEVKLATTVYEAVCDMAPIVDGTVYFRIEPVVETREDDVNWRDSKGRVTTRAYVDHLVDVRIAPRPGISV